MGGLDAELDWSHVLSGGEQQRVAFLRLLLHRPQVAFLDEVGNGKGRALVPCGFISGLQHTCAALALVPSSTQLSRKGEAPIHRPYHIPPHISHTFPALLPHLQATSAVDTATEARLYALLAGRVSSHVSVSHRLQLDAGRGVRHHNITCTCPSDFTPRPHHPHRCAGGPSTPAGADPLPEESLSPTLSYCSLPPCSLLLARRWAIACSWCGTTHTCWLMLGRKEEVPGPFTPRRSTRPYLRQQRTISDTLSFKRE